MISSDSPTNRTRAGARLALVLGIALALLLPAFWNGFPFVFSDTGEYVAHAATLDVPAYRTIGYSAVIALFGRHTSLWATAAAQALLLAALLAQLARVLAPRTPRWALAAGTMIIAVLTAASTRASWIMPDVFGPIMLLGLYLLLAQWHRLSRAGRALAVGSVVVAIPAHSTHVALALGLLLVNAATALVSGRARRARWRGIARGTACVALGTGMLLAFNFAHTRRLFITQNTHVFVLGHLVETGLAERLLADECPRGVHYDLCPYVRVMVDPATARPITIEQFVWHPYSPLYRIGGFQGSKDEASRILHGVLRRYPMQLAAEGVLYTIDQLGTISTLDGLESWRNAPWVDAYIHALRPRDYAAMHWSRQQNGTLHFNVLALLHELVALLAAAASLWLLFWPRRTRASADAASVAGFHRTVWWVLLGNAVLCGNLSGVFGRYQARFVWLVPLAVLLSLAAWRWPHLQEPGSGNSLHRGGAEDAERMDGAVAPREAALLSQSV